MSKRILMDAIHPEETRIVITDNEQVIEFDYESTVKKQIKGNVYLAKITRVEPSLQAAFVDYGGDKHGFLPFSEIHPDYFQLPLEAKRELLASLSASASRSNDSDIEDEFDDIEGDIEDEVSEDIIAEDAVDIDINDSEKEDAQEETNSTIEISNSEESVEEEESDTADNVIDISDSLNKADKAEEDEENTLENVENSDVAVENEDESEELSAESQSGNEDILEENTENIAETSSTPQRKVKPLKQRSVHKMYKINEVIKRGQLIQVQVIKEERGNKGASLTSYISLAGRYCVFMPKSNSQGGVSRRITNYEDRKRLKSYLAKLDVDGTGSVIVRTAGASRNQEEIERDYEYLKKLWNNIREMTLASTAPSFIHTEGDIIRRFIKDHFDNKIDEMIIDGENAYREARSFVKMIMPSSVKKVRRHRYKTPIFTKYGVENQIMQLYKNVAHMPSGGYIVINPTEALISIDVNSGKSTSGKDVEETALYSNIEAAKEIARQLRLRDLSGLVVIDFIDMINPKNRRMVEKTLKEEFKTDRAKVQIGRISLFGLLEMSRQRLRSNFWETNTLQCPHCKGMGVIRAPEATSVMILRAIEQSIYRGGYKEVNVYTNSDVIVYILNYKRSEIHAIENRHDIKLLMHPDPNIEGDAFRIEKSKNHSSTIKENMPAVNMLSSYDDDEDGNSYDSGSDDYENSNKRNKNYNNKRKRVKRQSNKNRNKDRKYGNNSTKVGANDSNAANNSENKGTSLLRGLWNSIIK